VTWRGLEAAREIASTMWSAATGARDGTAFWGHLTGRRFVDAEWAQHGLVGVLADITDRKRADQRQQHHNRVLKLLAEKAPLASVLDAMVRDVEAIRPNMLCSVLLLDADGKHLRHGAAPSLPDFLRTRRWGALFGMGLGSCGTSAFTGQAGHRGRRCQPPLVGAIPRTGARCGYSGLLVRSPFCRPRAQVLGTFAIYHRTATQPATRGIAC
jgi:hypothetical protein